MIKTPAFHNTPEASTAHLAAAISYAGDVQLINTTLLYPTTNLFVGKVVCRLLSVNSLCLGGLVEQLVQHDGGVVGTEHLPARSKEGVDFVRWTSVLAA